MSIPGTLYKAHGVVHRLHRPETAHFTRMLLQLIACVNAFRTSSIQSRGAKGGPMLFHLGEHTTLFYFGGS